MLIPFDHFDFLLKEFEDFWDKLAILTYSLIRPTGMMDHKILEFLTIFLIVITLLIGVSMLFGARNNRFIRRAANVGQKNDIQTLICKAAVAKIVLYLKVLEAAWGSLVADQGCLSIDCYSMSRACHMK